MTPSALPITIDTWNALNQAIAMGVRTVRFQDRTIEYASTDEMIKAANYVYQLLLGQGAIPGNGSSSSGPTRQIRMYSNKGL
jgi:hypothetical protein